MAIRFKRLFGRTEGRSGRAAPMGDKTRPRTSMGAIGRGALLPVVPRRASVAYTRFVYAMKLVLPAVAVVLVILVVAWPQLTREDKSFRIGIADVDVATGEEPSMVNARYTGTDDKKQPYTITADLARNLDAQGRRVLLDAPKADILLEDGTWLIMSAAEGIYQKNDETLDLTGRVTLFHDSGYEFRTERATIDLNLGEARGDMPVQGQGPFGDLTADGFVVRDQGRTLAFTGNARAVLYPAQEKDGEK